MIIKFDSRLYLTVYIAFSFVLIVLSLRLVAMNVEKTTTTITNNS